MAIHVGQQQERPDSLTGHRHPLGQSGAFANLGTETVTERSKQHC
jgi:hypothetical protein